jgi:hypothetical protein
MTLSGAHRIERPGRSRIKVTSAVKIIVASKRGGAGETIRSRIPPSFLLHAACDAAVRLPTWQTFNRYQKLLPRGRGDEKPQSTAVETQYIWRAEKGRSLEGLDIMSAARN